MTYDPRSSDPRSSNDNQNRPLGEVIRGYVESAMDHPKRQEIQKNILTEIFNSAAQQVEKAMSQVSVMFQQLARLQPDERDEQIIADLTQGRFPSVILKLPVDPRFCDFDMEDIREMPGWVKIHKIAQKMDVAVSLVGLTKEDDGGESGSPPRIVIDFSKEYSESDWSCSPDLPPLEEPALPKVQVRPGRQRIG